MASLEDYTVKQPLEIKQLADILVNGFYDTDDFQSKTQVSKAEIIELTKTRALDRLILLEYKLDLNLSAIVEDYEKSKVSLERKGRIEIVDLFKALLSQAKEQKDKSGWRSALGL